MKSFFYKLIIAFDRSFSKGFWSQLFWLFGIVLIMYLALVGVSLLGRIYTSGADDSLGRWYDIFFVLLDPGSTTAAMSTPFTLLCALLGLILFGGMLISVMSNVLERRVERYTNGEMSYSLKNHVVILGYNKSVPSLLEEIGRKHVNCQILLMTEIGSSDVREWIHANVDLHVERKLVVINGSRIAKDDLNRLCLQNGVREIYVIGEMNEEAHDEISMECVRRLAEILNEGSVDCHVQLDSSTMYSILQTVEQDISVTSKLTLLPFSFNEIWAQKALATVPSQEVGSEIHYVPLDGNGITRDSKKHVHLVVVGMNDMGLSLAINAAHILHFPNFRDGDFNTCSHITFIDPDAEKLGQAFRVRYKSLFDLSRWRSVSGDAAMSDDEWYDPIADPNSRYKHLGPVNFMDIQWEFINGDVYEGAVMNYLVCHAENRDEMLTIAFCNEDAEENASLCVGLPEVIRNGAHQILVRQKFNAVMINTLRQRYGFDKVKPFGMMDECYRENLLSDRYGKLINACYSDVDLSDKGLVDRVWMGASILDKWSSNYSANMLFVKFRWAGLDTSCPICKESIADAFDPNGENQDYIQKTEHNRWVTERLLLGVRPLYKDELDQWLKIEDENERKKDKKFKQKKEWRHVDICSNGMLEKVDPAALKFDNQINSNLWNLYNLMSGGSNN